MPCAQCDCIACAEQPDVCQIGAGVDGLMTQHLVGWLTAMESTLNKQQGGVLLITTSMYKTIEYSTHGSGAC